MAKAPKETSIHHRKPKGLGGKNNSENLIQVWTTQHRAWHTLFECNPADAICRIINAIWLDPDYKFVCVPKKHYDAVKSHADSLKRRRHEYR